MTSSLSLFVNSPIAIQSRIANPWFPVCQDPEWTENLSLPFLYEGSLDIIVRVLILGDRGRLVLVLPVPKQDQAQGLPDL